MVNIEKLYDKILDILKDYRCQYTDCDEGGCSLVDVLTPPDENDVKHGIEELELLAEYLTCRLDELENTKENK